MADRAERGAESRAMPQWLTWEDSKTTKTLLRARPSQTTQRTNQISQDFSTYLQQKPSGGGRRLLSCLQGGGLNRQHCLLSNSIFLPIKHPICSLLPWTCSLSTVQSDLGLFTQMRRSKPGLPPRHHIRHRPEILRLPLRQHHQEAPVRPQKSHGTRRENQMGLSPKPPSRKFP